MSTSWKEGPELCDGVLVRKDVHSKCAVTRHPVGSDTCEAVKVWNWAEAGKHCGTM